MVADAVASSRSSAEITGQFVYWGALALNPVRLRWRVATVVAAVAAIGAHGPPIFNAREGCRTVASAPGREPSSIPSWRALTAEGRSLAVTRHTLVCMTGQRMRAVAVVMAHPVGEVAVDRFVATFRRDVEEGIAAEEHLAATCEGRIGMEDLA